MLLADGKYIKPSKETRVLAILDSLSQDSALSQFELGRRLKLSGAMVNQYLKLLQEQNLIEFRPVNGKSYRYVLTSGGEKSRRQMFSDYSSETIRLYTNIKDFILSKLRSLELRGSKKIALFGASETCSCWCRRSRRSWTGRTRPAFCARRPRRSPNRTRDPG